MSKKWTSAQLDKTFEEFLKESVTDSDITERHKKPSVLDKLGQTPSLPSSVESSGKQWWLHDQDDDSELGNSTKSFLKKAQPKNKNEDNGQITPKKNGNGLSRSNSNTLDTGLQPGMETIQEDKEKEIFFKNIEENKTSTHVDYGKLNKELGDSSTTGKESNDKNRLVDDVMFLATDSLDQRQDGVGSDAKDLATNAMPHNDTAEADMAELKKMLQEVGMSTFGSSIRDQGDSKVIGDTLKDLSGTPVQRSHDVLSSTPASNGFNEKKTKPPAYDSKLSPVHSADSEIFKPSELRGFDLSPAVSRVVPDPKKDESGGETTEDMEKIDKLFSENVGDKSAPNFMQAKIASPRQQKSIGGKTDEPETMMSQVYSSQGSSINTAQENGKKKGRTKVYTSPHRKHAIGTPYSHVPSSGYGFSPVITRNESVKVASPRKKSPPVRPKSSPTKNPRSGSKPAKPERAQSAVDVNKKRQKNQSTFVLAPAFLKHANNEVKKKPPKSTKKSQQTKYGYTQGDDILDTVQSLAHLLHHNEKMNQQNKVESIKNRDTEVNTDHEDDSKYKALQEVVLKLENDNAKLKADLEKLEADKKASQHEFEEMQKDNFVLQSKLKYALGKIKNDSVDKSEDGKNDQEKSSTDESEVAKLRQALAEQETLITGYQQENERIYEQLKQAAKSNKENEKAMYEENRILKSDIADLKEELEKRIQIQKRATDAAQQHEDAPNYHDEMRNAQKMIRKLEFQLQTECGLHNKTKLALTNLRSQYEDLEKKIKSTTSSHTNSTHAIEVEHDKEMAKLRTKLQWYIENQALLDKDQVKLRKQQDEINDLRSKVANMSKIVRGKAAKEKEQKKIQDLERQVKELEKILKTKQTPNSVQALVFAAAQDKENAQEENRSASYWESQAKKLQTRLDEYDKESAMKLRSVQQQFNKMKFEYDAEVENLKMQAHDGPADIGKKTITIHHGDRVEELENKIEQDRQHFARSKDNFEKQIEYLQLLLEEQKNKNDKKPTSPARNKDLELKCAKQNNEINSLTELVMNLKSENEKLKKSASATPRKKVNRPTKNDRDYNPNNFAGENFSSLNDENEILQKEITELQMDLNKERSMKQQIISNSEANAGKLKQEYEAVINRLKAEIESHSMAAKPVEDYQHIISSLQNQMQAMQSKINKLTMANNEVHVLQKREKVLQAQIKTLVNELHSKKLQSDDMKSIALLEQKLIVLEEKYRIKEDELRNAIIGRADLSVQTEILKLRKMVDTKNVQIAQFRTELDSILLVLNELKSVGVVVHAPKSITSLLQ